MATRRLALSSCAWLALAAAACAAPRPQPPAVSTQAQAPAAGAGASQTAATTPESATTRDLDQLRKLKVRTGGPLPPRTLPEPVALDRSCRTDADCTVKDIGNCCGAYPACVNKDSPTDPAAVRAQCARTGSLSACGFREISACRCVDGTCSALTAAAPPAPPAPEPR